MNISNSEQQLMEIVWENEPLRSGALVSLAYEKLGWKKSTVYTIVKKLTEKGVIVSNNAVITSLLSRYEVLGDKSEEVINKNYGGSLPMFLAAFLGREKVTPKEAEELKRLIDEYTEKE